MFSRNLTINVMCLPRRNWMLLFISRTFFNKNRNFYLGENVVLFNALLPKIIYVKSILCKFFVKFVLSFCHSGSHRYYSYVTVTPL